ncbi:MAG: Asp-tRNA(Asn)/Glu-tRNA(Gln) amidotransferase subunit GatA [Alphaproteobacteria bacterium]|nr:Asp-tRNA(Asn)/Glu-tRNA(Gln) amidotransferase subunit GatA [Alphaproteobacteria bacterium]
MSTLTDLNMQQLLVGLQKKDFSALEVAKTYNAAVEKAAPLNAFITTTPEQALKQAAESDARRAAGKAGALEGVPLGIKDMFCTKGVRTTASSKMLENFVPTYESTVTQKLFDAGIVSLGKLSCDEFAMGASNITSAYGPVINPWTGADPVHAARQLVPGGSSGGSSAAVAAHAVVAATGTDTGGSCRQPAALTGTVGMKPTYGRCSRWGIVAFASSLDQAGTLTRTVWDSAKMLEVMAGFDDKDSTSADRPVPSFTGACGQSVKGLRVGIPREYRLDGIPDYVNKAWDDGIAMLKNAGAEIVDISLPNTAAALPVYYIIAPAEASSNLARYDGVRFGLRVPGKNLIDTYEQSRGAGFGPEVRRRILIGTYVLSAGYYDAYYLKAQQVRAKLMADFKAAYEKCDVILAPTAPDTAFGIGEKTADPVQMYLEDVFTVTANLVGIPAMSVPVGLAPNGLPLGLQIMARNWEEETMFRAASALESAAGFSAKPPFRV